MRIRSVAFLAICLPACVSISAGETDAPVAVETKADQAQSAADAAIELAKTVPTMSVADVEEGYIRNAALAQLYRWYQFYEYDGVPIENQLDILASDVHLVSGLGEANGHDDYRARVSQIPIEWDNAHIVKATDISAADDGSINMQVNITYLNKGALPDGGVRQADLTYTTTLSPTAGLLPEFKSIIIAQNQVGTAETFESEYTANRLKGLLHYWLAIIEDPKRDAEPVKEILADDFALNFSSGTITSFEEFEAWLSGPGSQVAASTHTVADFSYETITDGVYEMNAMLDWQGILPNGDEMVARTLHTWTVEDDPSERFARIKTVNVQLLVPFSPKP